MSDSPATTDDAPRAKPRDSGDVLWEEATPTPGKIGAAVIADFVKWVKMGAADPRDGKAKPVQTKIDFDKARQYWAFQPPVQSNPPKVKDAAWPSSYPPRMIF